MTNLSKIKRNRMKEILNDLKNNNMNDEQIKAINEIESYIDEKRFGLIWEEHEEEVNAQMEKNIPVFVEDKDKKIINDNDDGMNFILEGDNLHSLGLLEKTHKGKIDIIYIDPPYNTNNSLTYNDERVGEEDSFRHSMWLSFMSERLRKAKTLLSRQGLIFLSIDDNEGYNLKILCDEIFGEQNFMGSFSIIKAEGGGQAKNIIKGHDLLLVYASNLKEASPLARSKDVRGQIFEKDGERYWIQEDAYRKVYGTYGNLHYEEILDYKDEKYKENIDAKIESGEIILLKKGPNNMNVIGKVRNLKEDFSKYHSVMKHLNSSGKSDLEAFGLDKLFDYPKPVDLVKELISGAAFLRPGKLTVLDFFAGSGTTGQAVLEFKEETGREIDFILCTNNEVSAKQKLSFVKSFGYLKDYTPTSQTTEKAIENKIDKVLESEDITLDKLISRNPEEYETYGICQSVTLPRIKKTIKGFEWNKKGTKILFKKKLTEKSLYNIDEHLSKIEDIKKEHGYEKYKVKVDSSSNLILEASIESGEHYKGISANLKYFKTNFVSKLQDNDSTLSDELLMHIKEMAELEYSIDLDTTEAVKLVLDEKDLDHIFEDDHFKNLRLLVPTFVLLKGEQKVKAEERNISIIPIPNYYFSNEMKEAGEL